jgi:hypothetical protein
MEKLPDGARIPADEIAEEDRLDDGDLTESEKLPGDEDDDD